MEDCKTVPVFGDGADGARKLCGRRQNRRAVAAGDRALTDDDHRALGILQNAEELALAGHQFGQRICACAEIVVGITQFGLFADHADREIGHPEPLADTGIQDRGFKARVRADDQQRVGAFDALDRGG